jgi:addiction module HigA family antidote
MTDEEKAEEYVNSNGFCSYYNNIDSTEANEEIRQAYLDGLAEGRKEKEEIKMTKSKTYIATAPGVTIKEKLVTRGMSQKEFAVRMDMSEKHISHLINGEVILTPDVANRLESVLGVPAKFWNNLESIYRQKLLLQEEENRMEKDVEYWKNEYYYLKANPEKAYDDGE